MEIDNNKLFLKVKDHSVSGKNFELFHNEDLDMLITFPRPDENQLLKYYESDDYISHTDSNRSIFEKAYHLVKNVALKNKLRIINSEQTIKGNLLDIGAGTGDFLYQAKLDQWNVFGTEPSNKARSIATHKGLEITENTSQLPNANFDIITMWHVLEHVPDPVKQITELKRLLKPTGTIIIAVPNFKSYDAQHYGKFWAAYDVPRHLYHYSKTAITKLFAAEELTVVKIIPMKFDSFYVSLLSEKYKTGKMNPLKAFIIGLHSNLKSTKTKEASSHIYIINNV